MRNLGFVQQTITTNLDYLKFRELILRIRSLLGEYETAAWLSACPDALVAELLAEPDADLRRDFLALVLQARKQIWENRRCKVPELSGMPLKRVIKP